MSDFKFLTVNYKKLHVKADFVWLVEGLGRMGKETEFCLSGLPAIQDMFLKPIISSFGLTISMMSGI